MRLKNPYIAWLFGCYQICPNTLYPKISKGEHIETGEKRSADVHTQPERQNLCADLIKTADLLSNSLVHFSMLVFKYNRRLYL